MLLRERAQAWELSKSVIAPRLKVENMDEGKEEFETTFDKHFQGVGLYLYMTSSGDAAS